MSRARPGDARPGRWVSGFFLWTYLALLLFVWHGARLTPEGSVLIRLGAAILCDLVWIPLGLGLWSASLHWALETALRPSRPLERLAAAAPAAMGAVAIVSGFMNTAFVLMPVMLAVFLVRYLVRSMGRRPRHVPAQSLALVNLPFVLILLLTGSHYGGQLVPPPGRADAESSIRVMTYNLHADAGSGMRGAAIATIRREAPDVLLLQELSTAGCEALLRRELGDLYPHMLTTAGRARRSGDMVAVMSRHPVTVFSPEGFGSIDGGTHRILFAVLEVEGSRICVASVHLHSGGHGVEDAFRRRLPPAEAVDRISPGERSVEITRWRHAAYLAGTAAATGLPVILAGDLNDTPNSRVYRTLDKVLDNAFALRGWGLGATFGESWIIGKRRFREIPLIGLLARDLLRIDHVFVSPDLRVLSARVVRDAVGSDHRPVVVDVGLDRADSR